MNKFLLIAVLLLSFSGFTQTKSYYVGEFSNGEKMYIALYLDDQSFGDHVRIYNTSTDEGHIISIKRHEEYERYYFKKKKGWSNLVYFQYSEEYEYGLYMLNGKNEVGLKVYKINRSEIPNYIKSSNTKYERGYVAI